MEKVPPIEIKRSLKGEDDPANRVPFKYLNKGSMATVSRYSAVAQVGKIEFGGYIAWLAWLGLHLLYLVGFRNRFSTIMAWFITFNSHSRGQLATTSQMVYARLAMEMAQQQLKELVAVAERHAESPDELEQSETSTANEPAERQAAG